MTTDVLNKLRDRLVKLPGADVSLTAAEAQSLVDLLSEDDNDPERYRREQPSMSTTPIKLSDEVFLDYAIAGTLIDNATHHLDEALPTGQKRRAELAFRRLRRGVDELAVWLRAKGYEV